jgi:DNA-binding NarL/FixJ family response regulator
VLSWLGWTPRFEAVFGSPPYGYGPRLMMRSSGLRAPSVRLKRACADKEVVSEASDASSALRVVASLDPDVVLMDVYLLNSIGFEEASQIRMPMPLVRIVMLASLDGSAEASRAFASGLDAYLLKRDADECMAEAIRAVVRDERWASGNVPAIQP